MNKVLKHVVGSVVKIGEQKRLKMTKLTSIWPEMTLLWLIECKQVLETLNECYRTWRKFLKHVKVELWEVGENTPKNDQLD